MEYQKRSGTSGGFSGHFYETKLLSLLLFRLLHEELVEDFCLATNMDDVGAFDDICLKIKLVDHHRPFLVFLQLKHKDYKDAFLTLDNKTDVIKYINSISTIKRKIAMRNDRDLFFGGDIADTDCLFLLYTNARFKLTNSVSNMDDFNIEFDSSLIVLNNLLNTSSTVCSQQFYSDQHVKDFGNIILEEELKILAEHFFTLLIDKPNQSMNITNDEYIQQYHVILKQRVVNVTDIQTQEPDLKWRCLTFQQEFFDSEDKNIVIFRDTLYKEVFKKLSKLRNTNKTQEISRDLFTELTIDKLISSFLSEPSADTLSPLIGTFIACNEDGQLQFLIDTAVTTEKLRKINISSSTIAEAYLRSLKLRVPISFGNVDLVISNLKKIERRLKYLETGIVDLCQQYKQEMLYKVVTIDDTLDPGLLGSSGGLASAVGNLLVYDDETKMMKFSTDFTSLPKNAKMLFEKLINNAELIRNENHNLQVYRFHIKTKKFPKLHLDCTDQVKEFLGKLVVYERQKNHCELEELLKHEMQGRLISQSNHTSINVHSVFLHYHNEILKWRMSPSTGLYLTKASNLFKEAVNDIKEEPQISALHTTFHINYSRYFTYVFNDNATKWMELIELPTKMFIVTDTVILTTAKVIQCLKYHYSIDKYAVLNAECILKLPYAEFSSLKIELRKTSKLLIIVLHNAHDGSAIDNMLCKLAQATEGKSVIVITNNMFMNELNNYFPNTSVMFEDETQNLSAMTAKSQEEFIKQVYVIFQEQKLSLDLVLDDISVSFIRGSVLDRIIHDELIHFGTSLSSADYEEIKHLYIDRRVSPVSASEHDTYDDVHLVRTFYDIEDDVVLVTAAPGMGKSTLLTHLSLNTKQFDVTLFLVRVNFLDHSKQFYEWHRNKTSIDSVESLKFLCKVALKINNITFTIEICNEEAHLVSCGADELIIFQLNMFLHFYNRRRLIFVLDGFDEICPHYKEKVVNFLDIAKNQLRKRKMWVTSRPYSDILPHLRRVFDRCYKLERFTLKEQEQYLEKYWRAKRVYENVSDEQHGKFKVFIFFRTYLCEIGYNAINDKKLEDLLKLKDQFKGKKVDNLSGIPLLLYFIADYFLDRIILNNNSSKLDLDFDLHSMFEMFIENKLGKILFQNKNKIDLYRPDNIMKFEKERNECIKTHKQLAAYAVLHDPIFRELNFEELKGMNPLNDLGVEEFNHLLTKVKEGAEKVGLISHVTDNNTPVFIHRTFTEYFAAGYICDILKSDKFNSQQKILFYYSVLIRCHYGVRDWIYVKQKKDDDLRYFVKHIESRELNRLYDMKYVRWYFVHKILSEDQFIRLISSSADDYDTGYLEKYKHQLKCGHDINGDSLIKRLYSDISSKMKPHLKKHFVTNSKYNQQVNQRNKSRRRM